MVVGFLTPKNSSANLKSLPNKEFRQQLQPINIMEKPAKATVNTAFRGTVSSANLIKYYSEASDGIKTFKGLGILDIFTVLQNLWAIPLERFCQNECIQCAASSIPYKKPLSGKINRFLWNDYTSFTSGVGQFIKNTQEIASIKKIEPIKWEEVFSKDIALFLGSEPTTMKIYDLEGNTHRVCEATEKLYDATKQPILTTTSGYPIQDKGTHNATKELVQFYKETPKALASGFVFVSVNVFHSLMADSLKLEKINPEKSKELRLRYIDRMENTILTFWECGVTVTSRADCSSDIYGVFKSHKLNAEILERLKSKIDISTLNPDKINNWELLEYKLKNCEGHIAPLGRAEKFVHPTLLEYNKKRLKAAFNKESQNFRPQFPDLPFAKGAKVIDANGKVYFENGFPYKFEPTGIQLNFDYKDMETPPL